MAIGTEGVGGDNLAARVDIGAVNLGDFLRIGEAEQLGKLTGSQSCGLQHGSHTAVKQQMRGPRQGLMQEVVHGFPY